jgi:hypothetical protein
VEYRAGSSNTVADALSRRDTAELTVHAISGPHFDFIDRLRIAHTQDPALIALQEEISSGQRSRPWSLIDGMVAYEGRLYIPPGAPCCPNC